MEDMINCCPINVDVMIDDRYMLFVGASKPLDEVIKI
jgi:hypothetical protein